MTIHRVLLHSLIVCLMALTAFGNQPHLLGIPFAEQEVEESDSSEESTDEETSPRPGTSLRRYRVSLSRTISRQFFVGNQPTVTSQRFSFSVAQPVSSILAAHNGFGGPLRL